MNPPLGSGFAPSGAGLDLTLIGLDYIIIQWWDEPSSLGTLKVPFLRASFPCLPWPQENKSVPHIHVYIHVLACMYV